MKTARRYLAKEIYKSTVGVLLVLIGLFIFFDMVENLDNLGRDFTFLNLLTIQLISLPSLIFDLLPVALLIGTIIALASLVQRNEITILRVSGVSSLRFVINLWLITTPVMIFAFLLSEFLTPYAETTLARVNMKYLSKTSEDSLGSGSWFREKDKDNNLRIINVLDAGSGSELNGLNIFTISDKTGDILSISYAQKGHFEQTDEGSVLKLTDVSVKSHIPDMNKFLLDPDQPQKELYRMNSYPEVDLSTTLTPNRVSAGMLTPERMSTRELLDYIDYRQENHTSSTRYKVAIWRKLSYPFTLLVMMTLAAPIAFIQVRRGGAGVKVFLGILIGISFFVVNQLVLNLGRLSNMPPWLTATLPSLLAMAIALLTLVVLERKTRPGRRISYAQQKS